MTKENTPMNRPPGEPPGKPPDFDGGATETVTPEGRRGRGDPRQQKTLPAAETIGRYAVISHVESGGMGSVYAAFDPDLDRRVALKLVRADREGAQEQARLLQEARAMAQLAHPNVVRVYDVGLHQGQVFFTMEFVSGRNLLSWLRDRPSGWRPVVKLFRGVARGLQAAHSLGLVHRDLKPENILIGEDGVPRIVDFGLVRSLALPPALAEPASEPVSEPESTVLSPASLVPDETDPPMGTPAYMAPELLLGRPADERSDQYSFCVAFYLALTGEHPEKSPASGQHGQGKGLPARLGRILQRGLSPDPVDRFPSMAALEQQLSRLSRRSQWRWPVVAAASMLLLSAALWFSYFAGSGTPPCGGGEERLAGVWDKPRQEALKAAFLATGSPFAPEVLAGVLPVLDRYRSDWLAARLDACAATRVRGEQSEQLLDLRMLCLERGREELREVTDLLLAGSKEILPRAVHLTESLSSVAACADREALALLSPLPPGPEDRQEIERIQALVAQQSIRIKGREKIDMDVLEEAVADAEKVAYAPLVSQARDELGDAFLFQVGDSDAAVRNLEEALRAAIAGNDRLQATYLYGRLAEVNAFNRGDPERGQWWGSLAEAALKALGPDRKGEQFSLHSSLGLVDWSAERLEAAEAHWQQALELSQQLFGPADGNTAQLLNNLALIHTKSTEEKMAYLERALEIKERAYGAWNPLLANTLVNLGALLDSIGRYEEALPYARRASDVLAKFYGEHRDQAYPWILEAGILNRLDRPEEAEALLDRAALVIKDFGEQSPLRVELLLFRIEASMLRLRLPQAEAAYTEAAAASAAFAPGTFAHRTLRLARGRLDLLSGRPGEALRALEEALASSEAAQEDLAHWEAVCLPLSLGQAWAALGRPDPGLPFLETAVERAGRIEVEPTLRGASRLALAKVIRSRDGERAASLVRLAAQDLAAAHSPWSRRLAAEAERWH